MSTRLFFRKVVILLYGNAWALTHLPRPALYSSFAPKSFCHDGSTHTDQWIWFYSLDGLLYMHNITFHDFMHTRANSRMRVRDIHATLCLQCTRDSDCTQNTQVKLPEITFLTWWPWPLTLNIKHVRDFIKVNLHTKFCVCTSKGLVVRALTNWQTDRPLTREVKI